MPSNHELPLPWSAFLLEVDKALSKSTELRCLGGFASAMVYGIPRSTNDLDYIVVTPTEAFEEVEHLGGRDSKLALKHKVFLQRVGGVTDLPENYEDRLVDLNLGLSKLSLKILEPYDLVLSKLTRNSPKDREDVKYLAKDRKLRFSTLMERFATEMDYISNYERHEGTLNRVWRDYFAE